MTESPAKQGAPRGHTLAARGCCSAQAPSAPPTCLPGCLVPLALRPSVHLDTNPSSMPLELLVVAALRAWGDKVLGPTPRLPLVSFYPCECGGFPGAKGFPLSTACNCKQNLQPAVTNWPSPVCDMCFRKRSKTSCI